MKTLPRLLRRAPLLILTLASCSAPAAPAGGARPSSEERKVMLTPQSEALQRYVLGLRIPSSSRVRGSVEPPAGTIGEHHALRKLVDAGRAAEAVRSAVPLASFKPFHAVHLVLGDPEPDVNLDFVILPLVWSSSDGSYALATREWVNDFRSRSPLPVRPLSPSELRAYLLDLLALSSAPAAWSYRVSTVQLDPSLTCRYSYQGSGGSAGPLAGQGTVLFAEGGQVRDPAGDPLALPLLVEERAEDRP